MEAKKEENPTGKLFKFKVISRDRLQYGGNPWMELELDNKACISVTRQGGLGIWAFAWRPMMSDADCRAFDALCDEAWADVQNDSFESKEVI